MQYLPKTRSSCQIIPNKCKHLQWSHLNTIWLILAKIRLSCLQETPVHHEYPHFDMDYNNNPFLDKLVLRHRWTRLIWWVICENCFGWEDEWNQSIPEMSSNTMILISLNKSIQKLMIESLLVVFDSNTSKRVNPFSTFYALFCFPVRTTISSDQKSWKSCRLRIK